MDYEILINAAPLLVEALGQTLLLSLISVICGFSMGFVLAELGILGGSVVAFVVRLFIEAVRGVPVLVFVFLTYYLLPNIGVRMDKFYAGSIALSVFFAMFAAEIFRGAFRAIPMVQTEAGQALGMTRWRIQATVLLPQVVRIALPSLMNLAAIVIKSTSVISIIGVWELTLATNELVMRYMAPFTFLVTALAMYFVLCYGMVYGASFVSRRLDRSYRT